jgi:hypothetical protein
LSTSRSLPYSAGHVQLPNRVLLRSPCAPRHQVPCSASRVVPGAHRVDGPSTHRGSGPREVHTTAANIRICVDVNGCKVSGLKSHDYLVILQKLLPFVVREIFPEQVALLLIQLSRFFNSVSSKEIDVTEMQELSKSIPKTLCHLERFSLQHFLIL